ncbi:MAG: amino acid adenylation domain-containing protein [Acidobacteriia bacterium]|nr:amino acid adenylation domain-containing protein [Terriglobia bacterium]
MSGPPKRSFEFSEEKLALLKALAREEGLEDSLAGRIPLRGKAGPARLSSAQERLWFLEQLEPGSAVYNVSMRLRLVGPLQVESLTRSLNSIVQRHDVLRTHFESKDGEPMQVVEAACDVRLPVVDLEGLEAGQREAEFQRLALEEAQKPFDLGCAPLWRVTLVRLGKAEHVLLLTQHHIVSDGWSLGVFFHELEANYEAFCANRPSPLAALSLQYADYAEWQRQWLQGEVLEEQLGYWKRQLEGAPAVLELSTDRARPAVQSFRGTVRGRLLSPALLQGLKELSQRQNATLFMTLLAAFETLLSRYCGQSDIVVGSPIANRHRVEIEPLIGFFVNTLVLRTDLSGDPSFEQLLGRVREVALGAYAHQDLPFEKLVEELRPERVLSHNPLVQVMFALQNAPPPPLQLGDLKMHLEAGSSETAKFDLTLFLLEQENGLQTDIEYNTDLFDEATIEGWLTHWETLLEGIVAHPEYRLSQLPLLSGDERQQVLVEWNRTVSDYPRDKCVQQLFESQVEQTPDAVAVVSGEQQWTYRELNRRANQLAHYLKKLGVGAEVPVAMCLERSLDMVASVLAILKAGGAYVPLDSDYPRERLEFMLKDTGSPVLLTQSVLLEKLPSEQALVVCIDTDRPLIARESSENPSCATGPRSLAYIIYTSGSTGRPKGVMVEHRSVVRLVKETNYAHFGPNEVFLQLATISFDASTFELWGALLNGARLALMPERTISLEELGQAIRQFGVTTLWLTAGLFHLMVERRLEDLKPLRQLLAGGDVLSPPHVRKVLQGLEDCALINGYGPTENTTFTCCHVMRPGDPIADTVPIGRPISNTQVYLLDPHFQPVPIGVPGELCIGGDGLARGYLNQPELTAEKFVPNPFSSEPGARLYRTGDLVRYRRNGTIEFLGRGDLQVKIRGFRIELGEIETVLRQHDGVADAVVVAREEKAGGKRLIAYIVAKGRTQPGFDELRQFLKAKLPDYMVPSLFVPLEAFPLTPNGKVDRRALPEPEGPNLVAGQEFIAPRNPAEEMLAGLWAEVLDLERVGIHDNFFDLGGHSLLATRVISRIRELMQVELPLQRLFEFPTIAGLVECIEAARRGGPVPSTLPLQPVPRDQNLPLSFAQQRLWFLEQLEPGSAGYNIPMAVQLNGPLKVQPLERSLNSVAQRHEVLRTRFETRDGEPVQAVEAACEVTLPVVDLSGLEARQRRTEFQRLALEESQKPFNLQRAPLWRAKLVRLGEAEHVLLLTQHHIVSDGWSIDVLSHELGVLYEAFCSNKPSPLPALSLQYADFAVWQRQWLQGEVLESQLVYWKRQLAGAPALLELPTDRPRPPVQTFVGAVATLDLPKALSEQLRNLARSEGVTLFMLLLAAFQTLLHRYSRQEDVVVGSPIANRTRMEIEPLIGFFVNTLALRTDLSGNPTFRELLARVRAVALGAYSHQDLPFEKLVEEIRPERSLSYSPLFQVAFALENAPASPLELAGLTLTPLQVEWKNSKFDLTVFMHESPEGLRGGAEYNTDLFDTTTIERMLSHFRTLLEGIVADPAQPIAALPLLTGTERRQLLVEWNQTASEYPGNRCAHELFEAQVERTPESLAVKFGEQQLNYRALNRRANQLARHLKQCGVGPNVLVGICTERSPEMVVGILGILKAGGAYVPLDPAYPKERLAFMLEETRTPVLLTQQRLCSLIPPLGMKILCLDTDWSSIAHESEENLESGVTAEHLAYVIYTSGSTGRPKGVMIQHSGLVNLVSWHQREYAVTPDDCATLLASPAFDASVWELWPYLTAGASIHIADEETRLTAPKLVQWLTDEKITLTFLPTPLAEVVLQIPWPSNSPLRALLTGGDQLRQRPDRSLPFGLFNHYGPTENTVVTTWGRVEPGQKTDSPPPIGRPIANTRVYLLDANLNPVPVGVPGEMYVGGEGLSCGYLNRPDLTKEMFLPDPFSAHPSSRLYKTGDLARHLPDGNIEFLGRVDQQVKIRGFRIELGEIETVLRQHERIAEAVVIAREDKAGEKRLVGYVVSKGTEAPGFGELRTLLKSKLPDYMIPSSFMLLETLPLTPNGKVDRRALPAPESAQLDTGQHYIAPRTPLEKALAEIWAEALGLEKVGIQDNFFNLGGHSLLSMKVVYEVEKKTGLHINPRQMIFETVEQIAAACEAMKNQAKEVQTEGPSKTLLGALKGVFSRRG